MSRYCRYRVRYAFGQDSYRDPPKRCCTGTGDYTVDGGNLAPLRVASLLNSVAIYGTRVLHQSYTWKVHLVRE